jgi:hypothetical protein
MKTRALRTALLGFAAAAGLAFAARAADYHAPLTAFGQPDLQGTWTNASLTTLERPAFFKGLVVPEAAARAYESRRAQQMAAGNRPTDPKEGAPPVASDPGGYNVGWIDPGTTMGRINGEVRTSWLIDPADGKLPYSAAGKKTFEAALHKARTTFDGPEARPLGERCILGFGSSAGPPMLNVLYNNNYQIVQSPDSVAIVVEMNHDVRTIRLNAKGHLPPAIRPWMGDSIGRWEGETLVVETTNFNPGESLRPYFGATVYLSKDARVTERFTRVSPTQILYEFAVDDPAVFTQVWRAQMPLNAAKGPVYEYACHEGNYALPDILKGARQAEREGKTPEETGLSE